MRYTLRVSRPTAGRLHRVADESGRSEGEVLSELILALERWLAENREIIATLPAEPPEVKLTVQMQPESILRIEGMRMEALKAGLGLPRRGQLAALALSRVDPPDDP